MKKFFMVLVVMLVAGTFAHAGKKVGFQTGYWFDYPKDTRDSIVDGLKLGLPICSGDGEVRGAEISLFCSATDKIDGFQFSIFGGNICKFVHGVQLGLFSVANEKVEGGQVSVLNIARKVAGVQLGLINYTRHGVQLGLININEDGWMPVFIIFNFSDK